MLALEIITLLLLLSTPLAWSAWMVLWFVLMERKKRWMSDEQILHLGGAPDMNASFRMAFLYTDEMRADPMIRRLRQWRLVLFLWPFGAILIATIVFNFILPR